ncbi:MAG TPA: CmcJ/NvfI family oxidoreductase [candidate division Zixibacteria bacterium]|nr:CmcJ/NvfI family oxidoreductase [candidate division Zixibacteria bacterium]
MASAEPQGSPDLVRATLMYLIDTGQKPVSASRGRGTSTEHTGRYEERPVAIRNARPLRGLLSLEREGFVLVDHETRVKDFYDEEEVRSVYYPEMERLVKEQTGAARVVIFDHTLRAEDESTRAERQTQQPVRRVHNDYTNWSGPQRVRDILPPREAEELLRHRFAVIQVWRPIRNAVWTSPLAVADARSLSVQNLVPTERRYPDRVGEIYHITYSPDHAWYYFPGMARNEAIVFKTYDSAVDGRARWTAHAAFDDPACPPGAPPRESIEVRTFAFFAPA